MNWFAHPTTRWATLLTLCLAVVVAQIDTFIVNLAVHPIGAYFDAGIGALQWVIDSYNLAYAVLLLSGGLLADLYGRRRIFMVGAAVFTLASMLCALAPSVAILIAGRALAGLGGALLIPASLAIVRVVWQDPGERARALGIWGACNGLAMTVGPTAGGLLIHAFGWRSVFLIVVPLSLAALGLAIPTLPESSSPRGRHIDAPAQVLGALALGGLAFAAIRASVTPGVAIGAVIVALLALALFVKVEARQGAAALVPLDIFQVRQFRGAMTAMVGMTFGGYGMLFVLPLAWQSTGVLETVGAGLALVPMAVMFALVSPFTGAMIARFGERLLASGGVAVMGTGLLLIGLSTRHSGLIMVEAGLVLTGIGLGMALGPLTSAAVGAVAAARSGTVAALVSVARVAGATFGVAVLGSVYVLAGAGPHGLLVAMAVGGLTQIACAAVAAATMQAGHHAYGAAERSSTG